MCVGCLAERGSACMIENMWNVFPERVIEEKVKDMLISYNGSDVCVCVEVSVLGVKGGKKSFNLHSSLRMRRSEDE